MNRDTRTTRQALAATNTTARRQSKLSRDKQRLRARVRQAEHQATGQRAFAKGIAESYANAIGQIATRITKTARAIEHDANEAANLISYLPESVAK